MEFFHIDDLLDFSNDELFSSTTTTTTTDSDFFLHHQTPSGNSTAGVSTSISESDATNIHHSTIFPHDLCVPSDDVAELEWLSNFVDDAMTDFPMNDLTGITKSLPEASVPGRARSKRSRATSNFNSWSSFPESDIPANGKSNQTIDYSNKTRDYSSTPSIIAGNHSPVVRKCTHCASEKTPQWRTGPMGPKTLCNACGVRFKSGRLVPEYRPAASPTFVLTQHSNSHRKVMELRRQKEILREENNSHHLFYHQHHHDFKVC